MHYPQANTLNIPKLPVTFDNDQDLHGSCHFVNLRTLLSARVALTPGQVVGINLTLGHQAGSF